MLKEYVAMATRQYSDQKDLQPVTFKAVNETMARQHIINKFDCSYIWYFEEKETKS